MSPATALAQETWSTEWWRSNGVAVLGALLIAVVLTIVARLVVRRLGKRLATSDADTGGFSRRAATVTHTLTDTFLGFIWVITALVVLGQLGVNVAPLIASAGIVGVALGFGAQTLVRDGLSGFFILLEDQFGIGDSVDVHTSAGVISGRVEAFTLRVTAVRMYDGALNYIPNGNIAVVANKSRGWARAIVDVRVAYDEDVDRVRVVLTELFDELREGGELTDRLRSGPEVLGVQTLAADAIVIRVVADAVPGSRMDAERIIRERIATRLAERGIRVPVTPAQPRPGPAS